MTDEDARDLMQESRREERLSLEGPMLRIRDVAALVGLSKNKVRDDVTRGALKVVRVKCGQRWMHLVDREEAARYMAELFRA